MKKIVLCCAAICLLGLLFAGCDSEEELNKVTTAPAKPGADLLSLTWHGTIEALRIVQVSPNAGGKIESISVEEGQTVLQGDTLLMLDSADLRLQLKQAQAAYHTAQVAAANAATAFNENTLVWPAQIARDDALENYLRLKTLYEAEAISSVEFNNAASRLETAEAQLNAAQINQKSSYENSRAQVAGSQVAVEIAEKKLSDCMVTAPIDGLVAKINVEIGAFVSQQSQMVTLIDNSGIQVIIQVLETDIERIEPGMAMDIQVPALSETYRGIVSHIEPFGNARTGMFEVSVLLQEAAKPPRLGLTADVRVSGAKAAATVFVPEAGIIAEDNRAWVFVVENGHVYKREVFIISDKNAHIEVEGLFAGAEVVVNKSAPLADGEKVQVITWFAE
ncbi:MAG: efflux RND transporter periplasmic adaptor subunit [Clostridiales bacterium]|nr:efflux RND transporter periplasmic adaptor subunit [Clostridiales bacterium]